MNQPLRSPEEILVSYRQQIKTIEQTVDTLRKKKTAIAAGRLLTVVAGAAIIWSFWHSKEVVTGASVIFIIILIRLVFRDTDLTVQIKKLERLILVNQHEIDSITHISTSIHHSLSDYDDGYHFSDANHPYASDLDLFGPSSIFQWMNRCHADQSKEHLANCLKKPQGVEVIGEKQEAARELSGKQSFCQQFQATAMEFPLKTETQRRIEKWMISPQQGFHHPFWKWVQHIYPIIPIALFILYFLDMIPSNLFSFSIVALFLVHYSIIRKNAAEFSMLSGIEPEIGTLQEQLMLIETEHHNSSFLQSLQNRLKSGGFRSASDSLHALYGILKKIDWRGNLIVNAALQLFLIWDLRLILQLNEWKKKNKNQLGEWVGVIAETEFLISIASMVYNHPEWSFPLVDNLYFHFEAEGIGHPLIAVSKRVNNDFRLQGSGKLALITGSNMAGKSTFLRSIGINSVFALMGAPVSARRLSMSHDCLISSMRVADNLAENTSTFYAELKKLQFIIDEVNRKEPVFILLDEVLRGTNSDDRHKGSHALVKQLLASNTVAIMATHDTELARMEVNNPDLYNYHFEGSIVSEELAFDYKIKPGICESLNATALMKKIGIHFED